MRDNQPLIDLYREAKAEVVETLHDLPEDNDSSFVSSPENALHFLAVSKIISSEVDLFSFRVFYFLINDYILTSFDGKS